MYHLFLLAFLSPAPVTSAPLCFLAHTRHTSPVRPLHWLFLLLRTLFPQISTWPIPYLLRVSTPCHLLTSLFKISTCNCTWLAFPVPIFFFQITCHLQNTMQFTYLLFVVCLMKLEGKLFQGEDSCLFCSLMYCRDNVFHIWGVQKILTERKYELLFLPSVLWL